MLILHVIQGTDRGIKFELPEGEPQMIGRSSESLPITDTSVSRRHAELTPDDGRWYIRDLKSGNGTFVNGRRVTTEPVELKPGDQIRCGSTLLLFVIVGDTGGVNPIELIDAEHGLDVTVESTMARDINEDSMILASPDPLAAASQHLRVIYDLHALTSATLDRDELLVRVMSLIFNRFQPDRGFILLGDDADGILEPSVIRYRKKPKNLDEGHIPVSRTIIRHALQLHEGVLSTNAMNDERFRSGDSVRDYGIRSAICVPITANRRTFGVIHIDSSLANFTFTDSQLRLLTAIAQHTGLALLGKELIQSRVQTERLAAMGQTVASLSHSIKNILQGLRGGADAVELALNKSDLDLAREGWPILGRNLDRIYRLTMNMLAYSKPPTLDVEFSDLNALSREVVELLQPQLDRMKIALVLELDENMPPIPIDVNAVHQVLMNLTTNAIEAVERKRGIITIRSRFDDTAHQAVFEVSDNGPGIPESWREQIFEAFTSLKGQRGTGLGLAVSRKIISEHGGVITITSQVGQGATFRITLPSDAGHAKAGDTRLPRPRPTSDSEPW